MSTDTVAVRRLGASRWLVATGNEVSKGLRHAWSERLQISMEMPFFIAFMLLFSLVLGRGGQLAAGERLSWHLDPHTTTWIYLGFSVYSYAFFVSVKTFWRLLAEIQTGTIEQVYLSPLPAWLTCAVGRVTAALVETAFVVGSISLVTALVTDLQLSWHPAALGPLALVTVGGIGYALIIAGLTLVWKRVEILQEMLTGLIMFISGALIPLTALPGWVTDLARLLFLTHPIAAIRTSLLDGHAIPVWGIGGWAWLVATAAGWFALGIAVFAAGNRIAKRAGSLTRY